MASNITLVGPGQATTSLITWANNTATGGANVEIAELTGDVDEGSGVIILQDAGRSQAGNNYRVIRSDTPGVLRTVQNAKRYGNTITISENGLIFDTIKLMNTDTIKSRVAADAQASVDPVWYNCWLEVPNVTNERVYLNSHFSNLHILGCVVKSRSDNPYEPVVSSSKGFRTTTVMASTFLYGATEAIHVVTTDAHYADIKGNFFEADAYNLSEAGSITFDANNNAFGTTAPVWSPSSLSSVTTAEFENYPTDLRPAAGSVLIDAGADLTTIFASYDRPDYTFDPVDINDVQRGSSWDIGAYDRSAPVSGETLLVTQAAVSFVEQPVVVLSAEIITVLAQASFYTTAPVVIDNPLSVVATAISMVMSEIRLPTDIGIVGSTISYAGQITAVSAAAVIDAAAATVGLTGQDVRLPSGSDISAGQIGLTGASLLLPEQVLTNAASINVVEQPVSLIEGAAVSITDSTVGYLGQDTPVPESSGVTPASITIQGVHTDIAEAIAMVAATVGYAGEPATVTQAEISTVSQSIISAEPRVVAAYGMEQVLVAAAAIVMIGKRIDTGGDDADLTDLLTDHLTVKLTRRIT